MTTLQPAVRRQAAVQPSTVGTNAGIVAKSKLGAQGGLGVRRAMVRASRLLVVSVVLFAMGGLGILQVLQTSHVASLGYQIRAQEREQAALSAQVGQLEAQVATRSNLEQIHAEAVGRLGMVLPKETVRVQVSTAAPAVVPLPKRYVAPTEPVTLPQASWWERLLGVLPGFD
jgi:cell division protein FtsB